MIRAATLSLILGACAHSDQPMDDVFRLSPYSGAENCETVKDAAALQGLRLVDSPLPSFEGELCAEIRVSETGTIQFWFMEDATGNIFLAQRVIAETVGEKRRLRELGRYLVEGGARRNEADAPGDP